MPYIFGGVVMWLVGWGIVCSLRARASQDWPHVMGQVLSADVKSSSDDRFGIKMRYRYEVNGVEYISRRIAFGGSVTHTRQEEAGGELRWKRAGADIRVYYNPQKPAQATLERAAPTAKGNFISAAIVVTFVFIVAILGNLGVRL